MSTVARSYRQETALPPSAAEPSVTKPGSADDLHLERP